MSFSFQTVSQNKIILIWTRNKKGLWLNAKSIFFCGLLKEFQEFSGVCKTRCFSRQIHGQHPNKPEASNQQSQKAKQILACGQIGSTQMGLLYGLLISVFLKS